MNKNAIKKFAVWARRELIDRVTQRAMKYGITEENAQQLTQSSYDQRVVNGTVLSDVEVEQRNALLTHIQSRGFQQVIEEAAYTWFNRFAALRFMEVNGYLPSHVRVFTNEAGEFKPQILAEAIHLDLNGLNKNIVYKLEHDSNSDELFKYLLIVQCNALNNILPGLFERIEDYTELLFPDNQLREGSVIHKLVTDIPESDFNVSSGEGQIEIIGWLYQYYISEKHEEVVDPLHGKFVKKEDVPAATQLFTTDWVVRYLIDNSVGRYWIERNPKSSLADKLTYFVKPKNGQIKIVNETITPQELTVFDPCVGSGHFLVYAFEILFQIYLEFGYSEKEAASEIVKNNLYGLDIDNRATQLAYFAVMMKARQYDRRFLMRGIQPHIYEIQESNDANKTDIEQFYGKDIALRKDVEAILDVLTDAKEYGSIIQMPAVDFERINKRFEQLKIEKSLFNSYLLGEFQTLIRAAEIMSRKYAVVATNPPYLNKYDAKLKDYVVKYYKDYSSDLFSAFMYHNFAFCLDGGYTCFMTPFVWMFIKSYEKLRNYIIKSKTIVSLIQMEYSAYDEATVPICTFVFKNSDNYSNGLYFRLSEFKGGMDVQNRKVLEALADNNCDYLYEASQKNYSNIPGSPVAYWVSEKILSIFIKNETLGKIARPRIGQNTGDNNRFLRYWYEVSNTHITLGLSHDKLTTAKYKWLPYNKGGEYRRWYGNQEYVINWEDDGADIKAYAIIRNHGKHWSRYIQNIENMCKPGITWSFVTSGSFSVRYLPMGFICDVAGSAIFPEERIILELTALCNSVIATVVLQMLNPTINMQASNVASIPINPLVINNHKIITHTNNCISISRSDWDSFETSWDFARHPFIRNVPTIKEAYEQWAEECDQRFSQLKANEEELNRIFIDIYGLQDELTPEVEDKDVTVRKADLQRDVRSFISYAVGCMFGRYSLDVPGLAYAGGDWDASKYKTFQPDNDNVIPISDDEYFEDDIVGRFVKFVETVFGKKTLEENLSFIASALRPSASSLLPRQVIRSYFVNDFYTDHLKIYQKRPIYWLFDSGKKNGFKCLIYMHRYKPDVIARIRTDYIHEQQSRYRTILANLESRLNNASPSERVKLSKQIAQVKAQAEELRLYEEKIHHLADQMIAIDLDDGVKVNYAKFADVLAKIK